jgi:hypothetical protein
MQHTKTDDFSPRLYQDGSALQRILAEAPYLPRCSDDKTATRVRPREFAVRYPYMQINRAGFVSWLIFDLDHGDAWRWEDAGLPAPNLIVRNRANGHSHLYYAIQPVCTTAAARSKPIAYMKAIYEAFAAKLAADPSFHSGPVAKTPGHPWWLTHELHGVVYELGELADHVDLVASNPWSKGVSLDEVRHSRHCMLFEQLRHYAYAIVHRERASGTLESFTRLLDMYAHGKNNFTAHGFAANLALSSIRSTVRSVARWTWDRYTGSRRVNLGVMQLDPSLPLHERQKLAAQHTHDQRAKATESKIRAACRQLKAKGASLTQVAVAKLAGLTRQTVASYKHLLQATQEAPATVMFVKPSNSTVIPAVKYAPYQVTAGSSPGLGVAPILASSGSLFFDG